MGDRGASEPGYLAIPQLPMNAVSLPECQVVFLEGPLQLLKHLWRLCQTSRHCWTWPLTLHKVSLSRTPEIGPTGALDGSFMVHAHAHTLTSPTPTTVCPEDLVGSSWVWHPQWGCLTSLSLIEIGTWDPLTP